MSKDPIGFNGGRNLYGYVSNNPLAYTDPWGLEPQFIVISNPFLEDRYLLFHADSKKLLKVNLFWSEANNIIECDGIFSKSPGGMSDSEKLDWIMREGAKLGLIHAAFTWAEPIMAQYDLTDLLKNIHNNVSSLPGIRIFGSRGGTLNRAKVEQYKNDMLAGKWRFNDPNGQIGGYVDSQGRYMIGEGHHRVQAAIETGNPNILKALIDNGRWTQTSSLPSSAGPIPPMEP